MQPAQFESAVENIYRRDSRFDPQAYLFLKESLDFTLKRAAETNSGRARHVSGVELLGGFRDLALQEFGPMASTLMEDWGLSQTRHVGEMVFHLIEEQMFGKQDSDKLEDFEHVFDFHEAFEVPYIPKSRLASKTH
ncbi:putative repeat protein (TIGR04138 family) [Haloferula luteola]|uniref:Putative repeat protein (TIGR04138 family) n=1 Tax=Haloferula luteola TaxID=595692 RepID=A0A840V598_9BACT|nr:Minf_1886 family protein [Haloferula luteola]MBB5352206.1 putative repeat protein (TIGR04138 family) [Haloferula luteola]